MINADVLESVIELDQKLQDSLYEQMCNREITIEEYLEKMAILRQGHEAVRELLNQCSNQMPLNY